jgi:glycosyltransferase involved in cell wall biosynthesis
VSLLLRGRWLQRLKAGAKAILRRRLDAFFPSAESRAYQEWMLKRQQFRKQIFRAGPPKGLLSILTPVWDGSPVSYLRELAESIAQQNTNGFCEWVVLDNGCSNAKVLEYLSELKKWRWVRIERVKKNVGILRGLRRCLEAAKGRYVLPVDGDDILYPDALPIVSDAIVKNRYPALLYSDEDKVNGKQRYQPYFKPDFDPVLLLNSAYIAHLGAIDRKRALKVGAYGDSQTEGSPDWDLFIRFLMAREKAIHIPEIIYSWRVHATSTADDAARKPYIASSQEKVIRRFLERSSKKDFFVLEPSPLFAGGDHWRLRRKQVDAVPYVTIRYSDSGSGGIREYLEPARALAKQNGMICFENEELRIDDPDWPWEAMGIMELHDNVAMVGGKISNSAGTIEEAGLEFGFGEFCESPNRGRKLSDPGYFGQMWKQRSVGAVSTNISAVNAAFMVELIEKLPEQATLNFLGLWAGALALQTNRRIVYSPFITAVSGTERRSMGTEERNAFRQSYGVIEDSRYYPRVFSRVVGFELSKERASSN